MAIVFKGLNHLTSPSTSNPATIGKNLATLSNGIVVCTIHYAASGTERAGGAPTWNGNAMIEVEDYYSLSNSPGAGNEMWYAINANATGGAASTFSVPNTGSEELYLSLMAYDADTSVSFVDSFRNSGNDTIPPVNTTAFPINGDLYVVAGIFGESGSIDGFSGIQRYKTIIERSTYEIFGFDKLMSSAEIPYIDNNEDIFCFVTHTVSFAEDVTNVKPITPILLAPATGTTVGLQPRLDFYSLDDNYDDISYQIQLDDDSGFGSLHLNSLSAINAGFENLDLGTDTDPFNSAHEIGFTVQAAQALTNGVTYYWRVRAKDPGGTNSWSSWSSSRTIIADSGELEPTIVTDTADSTTFITDTPTLQFTGTDGNNDDLTYELQIDQAGTFDGLIDEYDETNQDGEWSFHGDSNKGNGQSFLGDGNDLEIVKFYCRKVGSPTGTVYARLFAHTGTFGSNGKATGSALATTSLNVSTLGTSLGWETFIFISPYTLVEGTPYVIMLEYDGGDSSNNVRLGNDYTSPAHPGNIVIKTNAGGYSGSTRDAIFQAFGVQLTYASDTDNGFAGKDDTDPFASALQISYTVQSALADGTYYWRVRVKDPSGSNTWSSWTATKTFLIDTLTDVWSGLLLGDLTNISGLQITNLDKISGNINDL